MRALAVIVVVALLSTRSIAASGNGAIRCSVETNVDLASTPLTVYGIPGSRVILRSANRVDYHLLWAVKRGDETADEEIYAKGYKSTELAVSANYRLVIKSFSSFPDGLRARFRLYRLTNESSHFVYLSQWAVVRVGSRPQIRGNINNMTLNEGEVIPAICANYSGIPEIDIHVTRRKRGFSESESVNSSRYSYDHQTGCVTFGKASRYDSGEYVISASNCLGQDQLEFSVNVRSRLAAEA
ncbi:uncharacterized protein LOC134176833 isoform X2 [Corticium candelabrum]|uniref:uncharacterized protein LOC134176833 isoform X2 n=1 Tax=Corticium candelabrum TaxID=121492 RepID=UPI002E265CDD|nr:uncharacterized protein LOC134176833 isoform X2 [Corticium candelabrum]